jgi:hypothetical protein
MEVSRHWRLRDERLRMVGELCQNVDCLKHIFPPRDICPYCNKPANVEHKFSGKGEVYSYTIVSQPPEGFEEFAPYVVALVQLAEGPKITAMLTDLETKWVEREINGELRQVQEFQVSIGMPVEMVTRKLKSDGDKGIILYGYKFRPPVKSLSEERIIFKAQEAEVPVSY